MDEAVNVGLVVVYMPGGGGDVVKINTRSMTSEDEGGEAGEEKQKDSGEGQEANEKDESPEEPNTDLTRKDTSTRFLAFMIIPSKRHDQRGKDIKAERPEDTANSICQQIAQMVNTARLRQRGIDVEDQSKTVGAKASAEGSAKTPVDNSSMNQDMLFLAVERKDIISLEEAKKSTGYIEALGYSLKKLVWAS